MAATRTDSVLLATCAAWPTGEPGGAVLVEAFAERGYAAEWVRWDAPGVDWSAADVVCVRSVWDYERRVEDFLSWARGVPSLVQGAGVFAWNIDKSYLLDLADERVPVVPSLVADDRRELRDAVGSFADAVVKPVVGAGGRGLVMVRDPADLREVTGDGPWLVQPLVESVRTVGEHSVFVLGGQVVSQCRKIPASGEIRVHEQYGGHSVAVRLDPAAADVALRAVRAAERITSTRLTYARADLLRLDDQWVVGELELTEPGLYLDVIPANARAFVGAVLAPQG